MKQDAKLLAKKIENEKDEEIKAKLEAELVRIEDGCCAFLVGRSSMGRISEVHGIGKRVGYFNIEDLSPHQDTSNTPAHEFGHIMGIADRYHFYMRAKTGGSATLWIIPLASSNDGKYGTLNKDNPDHKKGGQWVAGLWRNYDWHIQVPMYLPENYDIDYETDNNLFSSASPTITKLQMSIILNMEKIEQLPKGYEKITFFGGYNPRDPSPDWNRSNPLYIGTIEEKGKTYYVARSKKNKENTTATSENIDKLAQKHIWAWGHPFFENRPRSKRFESKDEGENKTTFEDIYNVENDKSMNTFLIELPYS